MNLEELLNIPEKNAEYIEQLIEIVRFIRKESSRKGYSLPANALANFTIEEVVQYLRGTRSFASFLRKAK